VSSKEATEEAHTLQQEAIAVAERSARLDRQRIASRIDTRAAIQNLIVFNDKVYERDEYVEFELWYPHASERGEILEALTLVSDNGQRIACQKIQSDGKIGEDRVRWLARVNAPSFGWATYAIVEDEAVLSPSMIPPEWAELQLLIARDDGDTWAHGITSYHPYFATFDVTRVEEFETGPLRRGRRSFLTYEHSRAEIEQFRYAGSEVEEVRIMLDWHEPDLTVLLAIPHGSANAHVRYEIPYCDLERPADGNEYPGQTWVDAFDTVSGNGLAVANDAKHSFSADPSNVYMTLARSKPYAYHVPPHEFRPAERMRYLDHGVQECRFLLLKHSSDLQPVELTRLSDMLNSPIHPHLESRHAGQLPQRRSLINCSDANVRIGAIKPAESGEGIIVRAVEQSGAPQEARLSSDQVNATFTIGPFEIKSFVVHEGSVTPVDFLERPV
jgi:alpha-mannosidase